MSTQDKLAIASIGLSIVILVLIGINYGWFS
ncbi:hypothetical protein PsAD26_04774 [Pseudovibrio sp. Ad26]|nr:hypothetical protein PsAD26_04774 [Pseudovibrio sp. Ad26]KZL28376.1 hypothetical protein PsWM33_00532 [Pseudovibrio sp. WM33]